MASIPKPIRKWIRRWVTGVGSGEVASQAPVQSVDGEIGDVTISVPVERVNGQTGDVTLTASDVNALADTYSAPVQDGSDINHQQTTNRTHEGDDLSPATLEADSATISGDKSDYHWEFIGQQTGDDATFYQVDISNAEFDTYMVEYAMRSQDSTDPVTLTFDGDYDNSGNGNYSYFDEGGTSNSDVDAVTLYKPNTSTATRAGGMVEIYTAGYNNGGHHKFSVDPGNIGQISSYSTAFGGPTPTNSIEIEIGGTAGLGTNYITVYGRNTL